MQVMLWIVVLSLLSAAAAMGLVAWRTARGVRERESARVELLRALAFPDASAVPASGPSISDWMTEFPSEQWITPASETNAPGASIFAGRAESETPLPRWISLFGVGAAMALLVTLYAVLAAGPEATSAVPDKRIELIALQHQFGPATALDVSGTIRNPADSRSLSQLVAVVSLFDTDDRVITSRMTPIEQPVLDAGETSAFSLTFPRVTGTVARYRVGFRLDGGDTIPHVDRRVSEPGAKAPSS